MFAKENNRLIINDNSGTVWIEPWGTDSVRIRMTADRVMDKNDWALLPCNAPTCSIVINDIDTTYPWAKHFVDVEKTTGQTATLTNGV